MWLCLCECSCLDLHRSAAARCLSAAKCCCFFFFLLQLWKSSHHCCIDTPVEGPVEECGEPAAWPHYLSLRASYPFKRPSSPSHTTLHLPHDEVLTILVYNLLFVCFFDVLQVLAGYNHILFNQTQDGLSLFTRHPVKILIWIFLLCLQSFANPRAIPFPIQVYGILPVLSYTECISAAADI